MPGASGPALPEDFEASDGASAADPRRRLEFLQLDEADGERLRTMLVDFRRWSDDFVEVFYRHLLSFHETARFLQSPEIVRWLKQAQHGHLQSALEAHWDDEFFTQRRKVGMAHAEIGLEPQYFLGAYNQYIQFSFERLAEKHAGDTEMFKTHAQSLLKAILFDVGLTLDAYFAQSTRNLRQALDMYWRANSELRQFARLTSHDLKTPLATVANLCDEALDEFGGEMPEEARELVSAAKDRTFRMSRMIDELLASAVAVEAGDSDEPFSSQEAWDEAVESVRPKLDQCGLQVKVLQRLPRLRGSKVLLREAFSHILSNALRYIERRPGSVTVRAEVHADRCELVVSDNGPGIPPEDLDRIFVPFRRLPMHKDLPGSGLGLYFAKNLVMQQGGRIWATSTPGHGSEFHIELRLAGDKRDHDD
jgi:signal transduction histidine kinase